MKRRKVGDDPETALASRHHGHQKQCLGASLSQITCAPQGCSSIKTRSRQRDDDPTTTQKKIFLSAEHTTSLVPADLADVTKACSLRSPSLAMLLDRLFYSAPLWLLAAPSSSPSVSDFLIVSCCIHPFFSFCWVHKPFFCGSLSMAAAATGQPSRLAAQPPTA